MFVYLLVSTGGTTYVGATTDLDHRLRAHNREIAGGAHATSIRVLKGETWTRVCHVAGFPDWKSALQFEWRFKQISRKYPLRMNPLERRVQALRDLLALERPTTKAIPYSEWPTPPRLVIETNRDLFVRMGMDPVVAVVDPDVVGPVDPEGGPGDPDGAVIGGPDGPIGPGVGSISPS